MSEEDNIIVQNSENENHNADVQNSENKNENPYLEREDARRAKQLEKLNEYVNQMAYKPIDPPLASQRTEKLAKPHKRNIIGTYMDHKDTLKPKERSERVGRIVADYQPITIEELSEKIRQHRQKQAKSEEIQKKRKVLYHQTLTKLENQCKEQLMNTIVRKFAKEVVKRAACRSESNMETESFQRLQKSILCNIFLALNVPNEDQSQDYVIYNKLANVFADMLIQTLFLAESDDGVLLDMNVGEYNLPRSNEKDVCIQLRALRAAKKKAVSKKAGEF